MKLLNRTQLRFRDQLRTDAGMAFRGTVMPLKSSGAGSTSFLDPRFALHTGHAEHIASGTVIFDVFGRSFLVADHDMTTQHRVSRLFQVSRKVSWTRMVTDVEPVTGLPRASREPELGPIWIEQEIYGREQIDRTTHIGLDRLRIVTGAALVLGDKVDGLTVRRTNTVYGVTVAEIQ